MAKNGDEEISEKEGHNLLGSPTFKKMENGRFKCVQTGHELPAQAKDSYAQSKHCRLGLIDAALAKNKPPLNMFNRDPTSRSKLICKLTGVTINKSEEHIWKHINGKRFLNKLEQKEAEELAPNGMMEEQTQQKITNPKVDGSKKKKKKRQQEENVSELVSEVELTPNGIVEEQIQQKISKPKADGLKKKKKKKKKQQEENVGELVSEVRKLSDKDTDSEEGEFWMPPKGERWDFDDGEDRWGCSGSESGSEDEDAEGADAATDEANMEATDEANEEAGEELSKRTKRMSIEIGPSSFASRKKKKKTEST